MAICERASWNPRGATPGGAITPRVMIYHVTADFGDATPHSGLEWHFEVALNGGIQQQVDTGLRADANYKANPFAISVETEGKGEGSWTDAQLDSCVYLAEWAMKHHPKILRQRCNRWDGSGFGFHTMWGAPSNWTPVAKSCPGPNRKVQFENELLPRILDIHDTPTPEATMPDSLILVSTPDRGGDGTWYVCGPWGRRAITDMRHANEMVFMGMARWGDPVNATVGVVDQRVIEQFAPVSYDPYFGVIANKVLPQLATVASKVGAPPAVDVNAIAAAVASKLGSSLSVNADIDSTDVTAIAKAVIAEIAS